MAGPSASQLANSLSGGSLSELRKRIFFLIGALIVFRTGTFIPVPGIDINVMREIFEQQRTGILGMFNMFSGGALERMSIFALGVMPYISASIIMQLMTVAVPTLEQLKKEGESGRRKITQYTRYGTVVLASLPSKLAASRSAQRPAIYGSAQKSAKASTGRDISQTARWA